MTYNQHKLLVFGVSIAVCVGINIGVAYTKIDPSMNILISTSVVTILPGLLLGGISWGVGRITHVEGILNKSTLTSKQVSKIWRYCCRYNLDKTTDFQTFLNQVDALVDEVSGEIKADGEDIFSVAMASMCIRYSSLWKGNWCGDDPGIRRLVNKYHDHIKMVEHFKLGF